jgi:hypothetical protein
VLEAVEIPANRDLACAQVRRSRQDTENRSAVDNLVVRNALNFFAAAASLREPAYMSNKALAQVKTIEFGIVFEAGKRIAKAAEDAEDAFHIKLALRSDRDERRSRNTLALNPDLGNHPEPPRIKRWKRNRSAN